MCQGSRGTQEGEETANETSTAVQRNGDGGLLGEVESGLSSAVSTVASAAGEVAAGVESAASTVASGVESAASTVTSAVGEVASDVGSAVSSAAKAVGGAVSDIAADVKGAVSAGINAVKSEMVGLDDGGLNEPVGALQVDERDVGYVLNFVLKEEASDELVPAEAFLAPLARGTTAVVNGTKVAAGGVEVLPTALPIVSRIVVAVPAIGVGLLLGAGIALTPVVIVHAEKVMERLGECGGTLAPGGLEACLENKKKKCKSCPDGDLLDGFGVWNVFLDSLGANAEQWLGQYVDDELPRTRGKVIINRQQFIGVVAGRANAAVLIACPCSGSPLARTVGAKLYNESEHAEMDALPDLTEEVMTWPEEERERGALGSTARSDACEKDYCRPTLQLWQSSVLPGGRFRTERAGSPNNWPERAAQEYNNEWQERTGRPMPLDWQEES